MDKKIIPTYKSFQMFYKVKIGGEKRHTQQTFQWFFIYQNLIYKSTKLMTRV